MHTFKVGDVVDCGMESGVVKGINLYTTREVVLTSFEVETPTGSTKWFGDNQLCYSGSKLTIGTPVTYSTGRGVVEYASAFSFPSAVQVCRVRLEDGRTQWCFASNLTLVSDVHVGASFKEET